MQVEANTDPDWIEVCRIDDILPNTGVTCLIGTRQVALFRVAPEDALYALEAFDPFSDANVLGRGIIGCHHGRPKVASPMYKHCFDLETGVCIDDPNVKLVTFPVRKVRDRVLIRVATPSKLCARSQNSPREGRA